MSVRIFNIEFNSYPESNRNNDADTYPNAGFYKKYTDNPSGSSNTPQITSDDIKTHFLDVASGVDTSGINKRMSKDISMDSTDAEDVELVQDFIFRI